MIGWKGDFRRDDQVEVAFDLVSTAGARALGIGDYGITAGSPATLFTIAVGCVAEAVAAHPARKLVLFDQDRRPRRGVSGCTHTDRERGHDLNRSLRSVLLRAQLALRGKGMKPAPFEYQAQPHSGKRSTCSCRIPRQP
jgi:hypothetical protein